MLINGIVSLRGGNGAMDSSSRWEELRDIREMQEYNMAVASDPTRRKHVMPGAIARRYVSACTSP